MRALLLCAAALAGFATHAAPPFPPTPQNREAVRQAALDHLHNGRFDAAADLLASPAAAPDDASARFFRAFAEYWRVLYDSENPERRERLRAALEATLERANGEIAEEPSNGGSHLWLGSAHLLLAQLRASEGHVLSAAYSAKRARSSLERAVEESSPEVESDFGLGTYQYYADRIPSLLKGLRVLLFLPGGNREEGLTRLARAAEGSRYFALEAQLMLAVIYADRREGLYDAALAEAARALRERPDTLAVLHGAARLDLDLQRPESALVHLDRAFRRIAEIGDVDPTVQATLHYLAASAELQRLRPDLALVHLRPLLDAPARAPVDLRPRMDRLAATCAVLAGQEGTSPFASAVSRVALDREEVAKLREASSALRAALGARPGDVGIGAERWVEHADATPESATLAFAAGRALLLEGHSDTAVLYLGRAAMDAESLPAAWRGPVMLYLGMAQDLRSARDSATRWYRNAIEERGYPGREAARLYASRPFTGRDLAALHPTPEFSDGGTHAPSPRR